MRYRKVRMDQVKPGMVVQGIRVTRVEIGPECRYADVDITFRDVTLFGKRDGKREESLDMGPGHWHTSAWERLYEITTAEQRRMKALGIKFDKRVWDTHRYPGCTRCAFHLYVDGEEQDGGTIADILHWVENDYIRLGKRNVVRRVRF